MRSSLLSIPKHREGGLHAQGDEEGEVDPETGLVRRNSLFKDKGAQIIAENEDAEFRERKLELWRRVKGAMNRWAQLRKMTKYGMAWLSEASKMSKLERAAFPDKHGYSYEFVIIFPVLADEDAPTEAKTLWESHTALLQNKGDHTITQNDILRQLQNCGLETETFPSVQGDETLCLIRCPPNVLGAFCERHKVEMELDPVKLEKLVTEGSPPHEIHSQPVPHDELICKYKPYDHIFAPYSRKIHEYYKCGVGLSHPFDRLLRTRIIARMIQSDLEFDKTKQGGAGLKLAELKKQGTIINYFAMHDESLQETVYKNWVSRATWPWALPSNLIRAYFGEKIALFFVFTAHYTTWLLPLALVGLITQLEIMLGGYDNAAMLAVFCTGTSVWSSLMLDAWKRKEWHHTMTWGMTRFFNSESQRPEFKGMSRPSLRDGLPELYYPEWTRRKQHIFSGSVTTIVIVINLAIQVFIFTFKTILLSYNLSFRMKQVLLLGSSMATSAQIGLADGVYQIVAISLTERENHRLDSQYYDSLIIKFAVFQLFNNYSSLFYVAFVKPYFGIACDTTISSSNPCMHELGLLLGIIFLSDVFSNIVYEIVLPRLRSRARAANEGLGTDGMAVDVTTGQAFMSSKAEQEAVLEEYDVIYDLLMDYKTINIQFGYMTFFVASLPILPVIAFCANILEIRVDGHKLLKEYRCPANHGAINIGMWKSVLMGYGVLTVVSNAALICFQTELLGFIFSSDKVSNATRISSFFFFQYVIFLGQLAMALLVEDVPREVAIQLARQEHFNTDVMDKLAAGGSDVLERFREMSRQLSRNSDGSGNNYNRIFELLSIDGTLISSHSLKLGLNLIGFKTTDLDMKILMNRIDEDKSGTLDLDEFKKFVLATVDDDVRTMCRRIRHRLKHRLDEVILLFEKHDKDGSGFIDAVELRTVLDTELGIDLTHKEATTLITRFDLDNTGTISVDEFARFLRGELAIDARELLLKLRQSFSLSEQNGMSVVKLFTAVDKQNVGLIAFTAVRAILSKYMGTLLSTYELRILESQYAYVIDENQCRYTDMYSDIMTAEPNTDELAELEERTAADDAKALQMAAEREEELGYLGSQNQASGGTNGNKSSEEMKRRSELDAFLDEDAIARGSRGGAGKSDPGLLRGLDWYTPSKMAHALARLAADYAAVGDLSNAEALYQHAVALAHAAESSSIAASNLSLRQAPGPANHLPPPAPSLQPFADAAMHSRYGHINHSSSSSGYAGGNSTLSSSGSVRPVRPGGSLLSSTGGAYLSSSIAPPFDGGARGVVALGGLGYELSELDARLESAREELLRTIARDSSLQVRPPLGPFTEAEAQKYGAESLPLPTWRSSPTTTRSPGGSSGLSTLFKPVHEESAFFDVNTEGPSQGLSSPDDAAQRQQFLSNMLEEPNVPKSMQEASDLGLVSTSNGKSGSNGEAENGNKPTSPTSSGRAARQSVLSLAARNDLKNAPLPSVPRRSVLSLAASGTGLAPPPAAKRVHVVEPPPRRNGGTTTAQGRPMNASVDLALYPDSRAERQAPGAATASVDRGSLNYHTQARSPKAEAAADFFAAAIANSKDPYMYQAATPPSPSYEEEPSLYEEESPPHRGDVSPETASSNYSQPSPSPAYYPDEPPYDEAVDPYMGSYEQEGYYEDEQYVEEDQSPTVSDASMGEYGRSSPYLDSQRGSSPSASPRLSPQMNSALPPLRPPPPPPSETMHPHPAPPLLSRAPPQPRPAQAPSQPPTGAAPVPAPPAVRHPSVVPGPPPISMAAVAMAALQKQTSVQPKPKMSGLVRKLQQDGKLKGAVEAAEAATATAIAATTATATTAKAASSTESPLLPPLPPPPPPPQPAAAPGTTTAAASREVNAALTSAVDPPRNGRKVAFSVSNSAAGSEPSNNEPGGKPPAFTPASLPLSSSSSMSQSTDPFSGLGDLPTRSGNGHGGSRFESLDRPPQEGPPPPPSLPAPSRVSPRLDPAGSPPHSPKGGEISL